MVSETFAIWRHLPTIIPWTCSSCTDHSTSYWTSSCVQFQATMFVRDREGYLWSIPSILDSNASISLAYHTLWFLTIPFSTAMHFHDIYLILLKFCSHLIHSLISNYSSLIPWTWACFFALTIRSIIFYTSITIVSKNNHKVRTIMRRDEEPWPNPMAGRTSENPNPSSGDLIIVVSSNR